MAIYTSGNKILKSLGGEILTKSDAIIDIDIDYNYELNGSNIKYMINKSNPCQTIYQHAAARQFIYNGTENAGEGDNTARELYLPHSTRMDSLDGTVKPYSVYFKAKMKDLDNSYLLETRGESGELASWCALYNDYLSFFGIQLFAADAELLDWFELLVSSNGIYTVALLNGNVKYNSNDIQLRLPYFKNQNVIFGNTRLGSLKFNGYFKTFKLWDRAIINPNDY